MTRLLVVIFCVLGISSVCFANNKKASWANLSALQPGEKIQVVETNSRKVSGTFLSFSATAVTVETASGGQAIPKEEVRSVKVMKNKHRLRNSLLFGAVGAGGGAVLGAVSYQSCHYPSFCIQPIGRGGAAGIGAALGFVGGAVLGLLWPSHKTIYQSPLH